MFKIRIIFQEVIIFYTYILYSESKHKYYVGQTGDLEKRLERHNSGNSRSTKSGIPWKIVYFEKYETRSQAMTREYQIKKMKSRIYIEQLIAEGRPE